jgi:hypothetical protein
MPFIRETPQLIAQVIEHRHGDTPFFGLSKALTESAVLASVDGNRTFASAANALTNC